MFTRIRSLVFALVLIQCGSAFAQAKSGSKPVALPAAPPPATPEQPEAGAAAPQAPDTTPQKGVVEKTAESVQQTAEQVTSTLGHSREIRGQGRAFALGNLAPLDMWVPTKFGATIGMINSADNSLELEYLRGSLAVPFLADDLGKMTDQRISLIRRSYSSRNSFNISYGLSYFDFQTNIGNELLNRVSGGGYPDLDLVILQSLGFNFAIGNRWALAQNVILGVDWFSWEQPVVTLKRKAAFVDYATNPKDKDDVEKAIKLISYLPRFSLLKVQLGVQF